MTKVLLIRPDIPKDAPLGKLPPYMPLGLAFLAAVLEKEGFEVAVLDNYILEKDQNSLAREIQEIKPDVIGVTCNIATTPTVAEVVEIGKQEGIPTVVGGPQVTIAPGRTLKRTGGDIGVVGEGEITFLELCKVLSIGHHITIEDIRNIPGLVIKASNENYLVTGKRKPIANLDILPFLPNHLFPYEKYARSTPEIRTTPLDWMSTSRGCPFNCAFCSNIHVWGRNYRCMGAKRIVDEIEHMMQTYGTRAIEFREDNFTVKKKRVLEFCKLISERGLKIDWMCESRVDLVNERLLETMRKSGCVYIYFGVESGSQRVLDFLRKGITLEQTENAFSLCKKVGIKTGASIMIGIPNQTLKENYESIDFVKQIDADIVYFNPFMGYPGSDIYQYIIDNDLIFSRWEEIIMPNSEALTWPQKVRLKTKAELLYNLSLPIFLRHIKRMGFRRFIEKGFITFVRYIKLWRSSNYKNIDKQEI